MKQKEDPTAKAARLREARQSGIELTKATQGNAAALGTDLRAIYGMRPDNTSLFNLIGTSSTGTVKKSTMARGSDGNRASNGYRATP